MCQTFGYNNQQQTQQNRQQGHPVFPTTQQFRMPMRPSSGSGTFRGGRVAELDAAVEPLNMSHVWWLNMVKLSEPPIFDVQKSYVFFQVLALCHFLCQAGSGHGSSGEAGPTATAI